MYNIKEYRKDMKMSQEELAQKAGVSRTVICGLETGSYKVTTTKTLSKIASALDKSVSDIFVPESSTNMTEA